MKTDFLKKDEIIKLFPTIDELKEIALSACK
jgi:hypothetical protein